MVAQGGAGTEAQIITQRIYQGQQQKKFVVLVKELDDAGEPAVPTFYGSRVHIPFFRENEFGTRFDQLLRWIYDKPEYVRPSLGSAPNFSESNSASATEVAFSHGRVISAMAGRTESRGPELSKFFDQTIAAFESLRPKESLNPESQSFVDYLSAFSSLRHSCAEVLYDVARSDDVDRYAEAVQAFFEGGLSFYDPSLKKGGFRDWDSDGFRLNFRFLFLRFVAALIKFRKFEFLDSFLRSQYFLRYKGSSRLVLYPALDSAFESFDYRNYKLGLRRISLVSDYHKVFADELKIDLLTMIEADFVLFFRSLRALQGGLERTWFPHTLILFDGGGDPLPIFVRCQSKNFFDRFSKVLGDVRAQDLKDFAIKAERNEISFPYRSQFFFFSPVNIIGAEKLCTLS